MGVLARAAAVSLFALLLFLSVYRVCYHRRLSYAEVVGDLPFLSVFVNDSDDCVAVSAFISHATALQVTVVMSVVIAIVKYVISSLLSTLLLRCRLLGQGTLPPPPTHVIQVGRGATAAEWRDSIAFSCTLQLPADSARPTAASFTL